MNSNLSELEFRILSSFYGNSPQRFREIAEKEGKDQKYAESLKNLLLKCLIELDPEETKEPNFSANFLRDDVLVLAKKYLITEDGKKKLDERK